MANPPIDHSKRSAQIVKMNKPVVDYLLSLNINNRTIRKSHVQWMVDAIKKDEFVLTGQGVAISESGILIDGQHRLTAIREAGYPPVELLVVTGLDDKARIYLDQNAKRTQADMLKIVLNKEITPRMTAAIAFNLHLREDAEDGFMYNRKKANLTVLVEEMSEYGELLARLVEATRGKVRASGLCALLHYAQKFDEDRAVEFANKIGLGTELRVNEAAYRIREWLSRPSSEQSRINAYRMMVSACIADSKNRDVTVIKGSHSWDELAKPNGNKEVKAA